MSEDREREEDPLLDIWITNWEQQCLQHIENEPEYEVLLQSERDLVNQKAWSQFQNTATAIAQLYKDRMQGVSLWLPFQTAAGTVTSLYKESSDAMKRLSELGQQCGYQKRTRDILNWVRKRRKHIRREDLIAYLAGKAPPPRPHHTHHPHSHHPHGHHHRGSPRPRMILDRTSLCHTAATNQNDNHFDHQNPGGIIVDDNLHTFREALALSNSPLRRRSSPHSVPELSTFITNEFARHCKRPAPSSPTHDVTMDSPTHKRSRLI
ncbi:UPF0472 protein C16orf72 homolog [Ischnura elegans]|uniref:UPF0472 protein C16orf72 homolog n=1 Tax=Ischnura elegans TaxID=197161 RepID=UPI001ED87806|nr:UPF0472 protein C16orf72 homolog [Ischnura elegans]